MWHSKQQNNDCSLVRIAGATRQRCQDSCGKFKTSGCLTSSNKHINTKVGEMVAQRLSVGQHVFVSDRFFFFLDCLGLSFQHIVEIAVKQPVICE